MKLSLLVLALLMLALLLTGCAGGNVDLNPTHGQPVCDALIGPIKYNSVNPKSRRHAGPDLAPDLKARNQVGDNLACPQYRGR